MFDRATGIGGTDAAAILGVNPYKDALTVQAYKKRWIPDSIETNDAMEAGLMLEGWIRQRWLTRRFEVISEFVNPGTVRHQTERWAYGHPDGIVVIDGVRLGIEIKCAFSVRSQMRWKDVGTDSLPPEYLIQTAWYAWITGIDSWYLLLFDGEIKEYRFKLDSELQAMIVNKCRDFWNRCVLGDETPDITGASSEYKTIMARYPVNTLNALDFDAATHLEPLADLERAQKALREAEREFEKQKHRTQLLIGESEGIIAEHCKVTWKADKRGARRFVAKFDGGDE